MANKLTTLLTRPPLARTVGEYEQVCDEFAQFAGGARVSERFAIPQGCLNADYHFDLERFEILLELKQLSRYRPCDTVDQYFSRCLSEGKLRNYAKLANGRIRIGPASLTTEDWCRFYDRFRPTVSDVLKKAARQLKMTQTFLPSPRTRRLRGVMLVNSGDFNLPTDLLLRLVERKMKREWKGGNFGSIDFVLCGSIDMVREHQHPAHARAIARSTDDEFLVASLRYLYDRWVRYWALAVGAEVDFRPGRATREGRTELSEPFSGKMLFVPPAEE